MQLHTTIESLRTALAHERQKGRIVGFVPTMGALHAGHVSLIERAHGENDVVVVSIFVNPLQFGINEDFTRYPRPLEKDCEMAKRAGAEHIFAPADHEMYPNGPTLTTVHVPDLTEQLEGANRRGHFDGVTTVVSKLFSIVGPCNAYFGEKDWQQLVVVTQMASDLSMPVNIVPCSIVREADGLALSSRNAYLKPDERAAAIMLSKALERGRQEIMGGNREASEVSAVMMDVLSRNPLVAADYAAVVGPDLSWPERIHGDTRLLVAARIGTTRLIDNVGVAV